MALTRPRAYQIYDIDYKQAVRVVTTTNIALAGSAPTIVDGITLTANDRVLVTGQSIGSQNGIYYVTTLGTGSNGTWSRSVDTNTTGELLGGTIVMVTEGIVYADTQWKLTTNDPITIGSTALTFVQNYSANSISAGTSNVVVNSNANVTVSSAGTANVLTVSNTGIAITGIVSATGNITGNYILGNGSQLSGIITTVNANTLTGNTLSSNVTNSSLTSVGILASLSVTGNITGGNILGGANVNATTHTGGTVSVTDNITGGNLISAALVQGVTVSASGNVVGGNVTTAGLISATGNVTGGNLISAALVQGVTVSASGNVIGGNVTTVGLISSTGNVTGGNILTAGLVSATGNVSGGNLNVTGNIVDTGALSIITGANGNIALAPNGTGIVTASGAFSASGNVTGGNILTGGLISATGNVTGNYILGNGSQLTGIVSGGTTTFSNTAPASPAIGDIWIQADTAVQYVYFSDGTSNQWAEMEASQSFSTAGSGTPGGADTQIQFNNSGSFGASANLTFNNATNTLSTATISATGNITGNVFIGNGSQLTGVAMSWSIANSNITMSTNRGYFVDTSGGAKTMTLPASAVIGDTVRINDLAGTFGTNNLTVARNGSNIQGVADDLVVSVNQSSFGLVYSNSTYGWKLLEF